MVRESIMKKIFKSIAVLIVLFSVPLVPSPGYARNGQKRKVKFSSVYTNLKTQCRSALTRREEKEAEERGQDIPSLCRGYGGYEIYLGSHGAFTQLQIRTKSRGDGQVVAMETMDFSDPIYVRQVEWRLANGVPFAVIFRRDVLSGNLGDDPATRKKTGEVLKVMGLKDERINFEVDVKTPKPNLEARRLADEAFQK
jgi:hypothetical protein